MKKIKAVLFDRDGTLIDSEDIYLEALDYAFDKQRVNVSQEDILYFVSKIPKECMDYIGNKYEIDVDLFLKDQKEKYESLMSDVKFSEDIKDLILLVKEKFNIGLVTSSGASSTDIVLENSNFKGIFETIITNDVCDKKKPYPEPYLRACKEIGLNPENCLAIEDSETGIESAKAAGMMCFAIPNEHTKHHDFSKADKIFENIFEIKEYL